MKNKKKSTVKTVNLDDLLKTGKLLTLMSDLNHFDIESWSTKDVDLPFDISAEEFLDYATSDLSSQIPHKLINALSNIKRSLDCSLDSLLFSFGLFEMSKQQKWNFPDKLKNLSNAGLISPQILRKINKKRNLLEHEFKKPRESDVEDAYDIVSLFLLYAKKFFRRLDEFYGIFGKEKLHLSLKFDYKKGELTVSSDYIFKNKIIIKANSNEYMNFIKHFIKIEEKIMR